MTARPFTGNSSEIIVEQLAALGVNYLFYNPGSREAPFFDALQANPGINGILALHEGSVTSMAGGYTQVEGEPAVMVVHLGAGLAQCMGQLINVWSLRFLTRLALQMIYSLVLMLPFRGYKCFYHST